VRWFPAAFGIFSDVGWDKFGYLTKNGDII